MKKLIALLSLGTLIGYSIVSLAATQIQTLQFKSEGDESVVEIVSDSTPSFESRTSSSDRQVIVDVQDASLSDVAKRRLDTSSFEGNVLLVSPYQVDGTARIVVQLRKNVESKITQEGNKILIRTPKGKSVENQSEKESLADINEASTDLDSVIDKNNNNSSAATNDIQVQSKHQKAPNDLLTEYAQSARTKRFTGRPITLQLRDADVRDVLRLIGEASGFNMIIGDDIKGTITLSLVDVPWDQALDVVLQTHHLGAERSGSLLRVVTLENLTKEKQQEVNAKLAIEANAPRVTRIFAINYAKLEDLVNVLTQYGRALQQVGGIGGTQIPKGLVQADNRTNSIIVQDTPDNVERMKKLIEILDTQTPQVLIEAKIIEASESAGRRISGKFALYRNDLGFATSGNAGDTTLALFGGVPTPPTATNIGSGQGLLGGNLNLYIFQDMNFPYTLFFQEDNQEIKTISSPKAVVLNKETATIVQSQPTAITQTIATANGTTTGAVVTQANISLAVTPTVTNDGSVLMQLSISRDVPQSVGDAGSAVGVRNINTRVLVDSGSTLVMGGIFVDTQTKTESGTPFLRKIPIIGWLFGNEVKSSDRSEIFFFITPRILNEKEAGIGTS